jgi:hypothetical protein
MKIHPKIMSIGTSRALKFRDYFFKNRNDFYNAGRTVRNINQYIPFLKKVRKNRNLKILILELDQCFFNENWINENRKLYRTKYAYLKLLDSKPSPHYIFRHEFFKILRNIFEGKIHFNGLRYSMNGSRIGISAIMNNDGIRNDGSYSNGFRINNYEKWYDYEFKSSLKKIEKGNKRFEYGEKVEKKALLELDEILDYCKSRNIHVVGFFPPYAPTVVDRLKEKGKIYSYIWQIKEKAAPIFKRYSYKIFDFTDISGFGSTDKEFIDGLHGSEKTYAKLFIEMASKDLLLRKYANIEMLKDLISNSKSDLLLKSGILD